MVDIDLGRFDGCDTPIDDFPEIYDYESGRGVLWSLPESQALLGLNGQGDPEVVDFAGDSPHVLINATTGAGKSVAARTIATQALIKGAEVIILDVKRISHRWAKNLPGVTYASSLPEIASALVSLGVHLHKRNEIIEQWPGDVESADVGPRLVVVFEELNATMDALAELEKQGSRDSYTPSRAFGDIMFLGRAAKVNMIGIAQYAADRKVLRPAIRENFGTRVLIRHTWESWNALVPRASRSGGSPAAPTAVGRGYVVKGGRPVQSQLLYLDEELSAELVRHAYAARERAGLIATPSKRQVRRYQREAIAATQRQTGMEP